MDNEKWDELDLRASSIICVSLDKIILVNVVSMLSAKELWKKLEGIYQGNGISNQLLLKKQFHSLRMDEHTKVSDHLSVLNGIVSELETIGVTINDKEKTLRLTWLLLSSYEHIKPIFKYGKEILSFGEVVSKIIYEEIRLKGEDNTSSNLVLVAIGKYYVKKINGTSVRCWKCIKIGHVKYKCHDRATLEKGSKSNACNVSLVVGDDDLL